MPPLNVERVRALVTRWITLACLSLLVLPGLSSSAQGESYAGILVVFGNGEVVPACVEFSEARLSAAELLRRAGHEPVTSSEGGVETICEIGGEGCSFPEQECLCYWTTETASWVFEAWRGGDWRDISLGGAGSHLSHQDVALLYWGAPVAGRPDVDLSQVCAEQRAEPTPTASPTLAPTVPAKVTATAPTDTSTPSPTAAEPGSTQQTPSPVPASATPSPTLPTAEPSPTETPVLPAPTSTAVPPTPTESLGAYPYSSTSPPTAAPGLPTSAVANSAYPSPVVSTATSTPSATASPAPATPTHTASPSPTVATPTMVPSPAPSATSPPPPPPPTPTSSPIPLPSETAIQTPSPEPRLHSAEPAIPPTGPSPDPTSTPDPVAVALATTVARSRPTSAPASSPAPRRDYGAFVFLSALLVVGIGYVVLSYGSRKPPSN